ncbi:MAG: tRNA (adenosine(37)-N6)-threonylcarbamoyltransferase complex dimerization subunit type 1 TsaB [Chloroflexota bacterium]
MSGSHDGRRRALLAFDTSTSRCIVATATPAGTLDGSTMWPAGYRHGETLLPTIGRFLSEQNIRRSRLAGIIVGTGPGAFTGLRVGLATAKTLAASMRLPLVGVSTAEALLDAAGAAAAADAGDRTARIGPFVLLLPAGPSDRLVIRHGEPARLVPGGSDPDIAPGETLVALDLPERAPVDALVRGEAAFSRLAAALVGLGAERLARNDVDDPARLVPEYVTLPRGVTALEGEVSWSRDPR